MIVDVADIKAAESIFTLDDVNMSWSNDKNMFKAGSMAPVFKAEMENSMEKLSGRDNMDYSGFGNKMVTKADYDRYKNSLKLFTFRPDKAHSPNIAAENIRHMGMDAAGEIGAYAENEEIKDKNAEDDGAPFLQKAVLGLRSAGSSLLDTLGTIPSALKTDPDAMPAGLQKILDNLKTLDLPISGLLEKHPKLHSASKDELRRARPRCQRRSQT